MENSARSMLKLFLQGKQCFMGGQGWWQRKHNVAPRTSEPQHRPHSPPSLPPSSAPPWLTHRFRAPLAFRRVLLSETREADSQERRRHDPGGAARTLGSGVPPAQGWQTEGGRGAAQHHVGDPVLQRRKANVVLRRRKRDGVEHILRSYRCSGAPVFAVLSCSPPSRPFIP